ncbi:MAG: hypothetical protein WCG00_17830 [Hyphomicrobiales bacterium]
MSMIEPANQFVRAETLRQLRLQLAETDDEPARHVLLRRIEELEQEDKNEGED